MTGTDALIIEWELIAILITLFGGFGTLAFLLGRKNSDIEHLQKEVKEVKENQEAHEGECKEHRAKQDEANEEVKERLATGSTKLALLNAGQERIEKSLDEIKGSLKNESWLPPHSRGD